MENKKSIEEIKSDRNNLLYSLLPISLLVFGGICLLVCVKGIAGIVAGGFLIGVGVSLMVLLGVAIGECNEEIRQIKVNESKQRLDDAFESYNKIGEKIMELRTEMEIYDNLRFRDRVLKDKFGGITNKKLREDFLKTKLNNIISVKDAIGQFELYNFRYKNIYKIVLEEFQRKQAVLNQYAEKPKKVGKRSVKN